MRSIRALGPAGLVALALFVSACTDDDEGGGGTTTTSAIDADAAAATFELVSLGNDSSYVAALCSLDLFHPGDEDDPMGWLIGELEQLPTDSDDEEAEREWMIERLDASQQLEDTLSTDDLSSVAAVLRARCA